MNLLFELVWACWFLSEILLNRVFRARDKGAEDYDKNSLRLIWITILGSIFLGVFCTIYIDVPIVRAPWLNYAGLLIIMAGMILRFVAIRTLGRFFTVDLSVREGYTLVNTGLYKYIRHPSYSGSLLSFLGFPFSLNNWISLVVIFVPVLLVFLYRIRLEERMLVKQLGPEYEAYQKTTKRLIPWIY